MSKLDYLTIAIVTLCVAALIFLIVKASKLGQEKIPVTTLPPDNTEIYVDPYPIDGVDSLIIDDLEGNSATSGSDTQGGNSATDPDDSGSVPATTNPAPTSPDESGSTTTTPIRPSKRGDYLVLAGSFRQQANAETQAAKLRKLGYAQAEVTMFNRGAYAVVLVDRFSSMADAKRLTEELRAKHSVEARVMERRGQ